MGKKLKSIGGRSLKQKKSGGNMNKVLQEAQKAQVALEEEMAKMEEKFATLEFDATSGGGVVKVIATGDLKIKDIEISEELKDEDFDIVKDMIIAATNEVIEKINTTKEEENEKINDKYLSGLSDFGF
jgi:hypothetical protein